MKSSICGTILFILWKSHVPLLRYPIFYNSNHFINFKIITPRWLLTLEVEYNFDIFWIIYHLVMKLAQLIDLVMGNIIRKKFARFLELGPKSRPFLIHQPNTINHHLQSKNGCLVLTTKLQDFIFGLASSYYCQSS